jgi:hypothetical protein
MEFAAWPNRLFYLVEPTITRRDYVFRQSTWFARVRNKRPAGLEGLRTKSRRRAECRAYDRNIGMPNCRLSKTRKLGECERSHVGAAKES